MFNDETDSDCDATADGIINCLNMLAEEAAALNLGRTLAAIHAALRACHDEGMLPMRPAYEERVLH